MSNRIDLTGQKIGRLTALQMNSERKKGKISWLCICECGKVVNILTDALRSGATKSCGCLKVDLFEKRKFELSKLANEKKVSKKIPKPCLYCGKLFDVKPSHYKTRTYCTSKCMADAYKTILSGKNNPNYKSAGVKACQTCGREFKNYNKSSRFCSLSCANKTDEKISRLVAMAKMPRTPRPKKIKIPKLIVEKKKTGPKPKALVPNRVCNQCGGQYHSYIKTRQFCSHKCSHAAGTLQKAGLHAAMSRKHYGDKKDINHKEIVECFRSRKCFVYDTSHVGNGFPDIVVWIKEKWEMVEIKNPKTKYGRRGLNKLQQKFAEEWTGGKIHIVRTEEDVIKLIETL